MATVAPDGAPAHATNGLPKQEEDRAAPFEKFNIRWQGIGFGVDGDEGVLRIHEAYAQKPTKDSKGPGQWWLPITPDNACEQFKTFYRCLFSARSLGEAHKYIEHYFAPDARFSHPLFYVQGWPAIKAWYNQAWLLTLGSSYSPLALLYSVEVRFGRTFFDRKQGVLAIEVMPGGAPKFFGPTGFLPIFIIFYLRPRTDGKEGLWATYQEDHYMPRLLLTQLPFTSPFTYIVDGFLRPFFGKLVTGLHQALGLI